ncbi:MAG: SGNH/GDSL hydrolase family protein [Fretibacterium sp.]|nr:SGNH/GDSL hydrolase family protein [Fretibacterium sp.]
MSGILAFVILTVTCLLYYNLPVHAVCDDGVTDYKRKPYRFCSRGTEGFSLARTNNDGYFNLFDYEKDLPISVLIMGSSHMEALQMMMRESTASRLNSMWNGIVYNIGISGHSFLVCANNIQSASRKYCPTQYIIVETSSLSFLDKSLEDIVHGSFERIPSNAKGLLAILSRNQYLRLLYHQIEAHLKRWNADKTIELTREEANNNPELLSKVFCKMRDAAQSSGAKLIIAYHPGVALNEDGSLRIVSDEEVTAQFAGLCKETGIHFLDMSSRFLEEYNRDYTLPYGFCNTSVGKGHLNREGHRMMADELFKLMKRIEGEIKG